VLERAASLVDGAALRRAGQRRRRGASCTGLDGAARCGARRSRPAPAKSSHRRARPRRDWSIGVEALTPSELRIVRLARDGRTNRQIAQELYVSIKTVEGHLARAYGKLGIASRESSTACSMRKTRVFVRASARGCGGTAAPAPGSRAAIGRARHGGDQ
jgi:DNA-binding CsgD family transcriptional regulator